MIQASFVYQTPAGWGSPSSFFLPCCQVLTPLVLKAPTATPVLFPQRSLALLLTESRKPQLPMLPLPFPGAVQGSCKPPSASISQSREATHFRVAHDLGTKEQAHQ